MPKGTKELTSSRREEIINACEKLYQTKTFKEITIKDIAEETSFARPSIYNYFETKEEIFLSLLCREYVLWNKELQDMYHSHKTMTKDEFASAVAHTLEHRTQLLRLKAMNRYSMEKHSRIEYLVQHRKAGAATMDTIGKCLKTYFPEMNDGDVQSFIYSFFPFLYGIYPYTEVSENQQAAIEEAGIPFQYMTIYEITYNCIRRLLGM